MKKVRTRNNRVDLHLSEKEYNLIKERMAEVRTENKSTFIRKMTLKGYVLHVDVAKGL